MHNTRSTTLNFSIPQAGVLHGFAGYFEAVLYGNIGISTHPERKDRVSKDMLSWFPCFFPIKVYIQSLYDLYWPSYGSQEPLYLPSNSELQLTMWRLTTSQKVWYEWYAESFLPTQEIRQPSSPGSYGMTVAISPMMSAPSPMMDAADMSFSESTSSSMDIEAGESEVTYGVTKIGQTSLHNPGGRSSWYGL